jgi:transcriptional regulator with XRE-family HTH domain
MERLKMAKRTGDLRLVNADAPQPKLGERLCLLREEIGKITPGGMSQETLARLTHDAAAALGRGYSSIDRNTINKIERGRLGLKHYEHRAVIARVLEMSTDDLSAYLDDRIDLPEAMKRRGHRPAARLVIRHVDRDDWEELVEAAKQENPLLDDETFREIGEGPTYADAPLDATMLAEMAAITQKHMAKRRRGQGTT